MGLPSPADVGAASGVLGRLRSELNAVLRGKPRVVELSLTCVLAGGHLLIQDVPGVGKTTLAASLAQLLGGSFARVQFTADLLPADLTGTNVLDPRTGDWRFRQGPLFHNVVLADEINRTTPRCQSALFEAMSEGRVSSDGHTRELPRPFFVVATQNPFDGAGTFPLPDSQLDRFLMRVSIGYPDRESERAVLRGESGAPRLASVLDPAQVVQLQEVAAAVSVVSEVEDYLLDLVERSRNDQRLLRGVSPRGAQLLHRAVRAHALVSGRGYVIPEDVRTLAGPVLGHRVLPRRQGARGGAGGEAVVQALLAELTPPG